VGGGCLGGAGGRGASAMMRTAGARGRAGARLTGLVWALGLHASLCSSLAATPAEGGFAGRSAGVPAGGWARGSAGAHARAAGVHAPASCDAAEDSIDEDLKLHLGQIDGLVGQMAQFQVCASPPAPLAALKSGLMAPRTSTDACGGRRRAAYADTGSVQERAAVLASELDKRSAENDRLVAALESGLLLT